MTDRPTIWFVTPAWKRLEISRIVFDQRLEALKKLRGLGINAEACVIADDENLELARERGFATVERSNRYLGAKFNDGYQFAAAEGADYVCPIGSDSWCDPQFIADSLPGAYARTVVYSRNYTMIRPDGLRRGQLLCEYDGGATMFFPTRALSACAYRPVGETLPRGCDGSTIASLKKGGSLTLAIGEAHRLETVTIRSELQISDYATLLKRWGVGETADTFGGLTKYYPAKLVNDVRDFYSARGGQ